MIKYVSGDFFDFEADIRVNTVNCVGVMGAGVALMFKEKFPDMFRDYYKACKKGEVKPGVPHVWSEITIFSNYTIINFPTKVDWRNPSKYEYIEDGLVWLRDYLIDKNDSTITVPALGCGHGGLDWQKVKTLIEKYLGELKATILVFEPSSSRVNKNEKLYLQEFKDKEIHTIYPDDKLYPKNLLGHSSKVIYYKGNIKLLENKSIALLTNKNLEPKEKNTISDIINELPNDKFVFLQGYGNKSEIDMVKFVLSKGFKTIIIIPYGILNLKVRKDLQVFWNYENLLVLSIADPLQKWKIYEFDKAFKLQIKVADISIINTLDLNFIYKYKKDIKESISKVYYVNYWKDENEFFCDLLAKRIGKNKINMKPNVKPLLKDIYE